MNSLAAVTLLALINFSGNEWHRREFETLSMRECEADRDIERGVGLKGNVRFVVANYPVSDTDKNTYTDNDGAIFQSVNGPLKLVFRDRPTVPLQSRALREECVANLRRHSPQHSGELPHFLHKGPVFIIATARNVSGFYSGTRGGGCSNILNLNFQHNVDEVGFKTGRADEPYTTDYDPCALVGDHGLPGYLRTSCSGIGTFDGGFVRTASKHQVPDNQGRARSRNQELPQSQLDQIVGRIRHAPLGIQILVSALILYPLLFLSGYSLTFVTHHSNPIHRLGGALVSIGCFLGLLALISRAVYGNWMEVFRLLLT